MSSAYIAKWLRGLGYRLLEGSVLAIRGKLTALQVVEDIYRRPDWDAVSAVCVPGQQKWPGVYDCCFTWVDWSILFCSVIVGEHSKIEEEEEEEGRDRRERDNDVRWWMGHISHRLRTRYSGGGSFIMYTRRVGVSFLVTGVSDSQSRRVQQRLAHTHTK